jgi:hypothetical protein
MTNKVEDKPEQKPTQDLEKELELEKIRFLDASKRAASAIKHDLKIGNWFRQYPFESAVAIIGVGFCAGYLIQQKRKSKLLF